MEINLLIKQLRDLDLSTYPKDKILALFKKIGNIGYVEVSLHKGESIMRARPLPIGTHFEKKSDYSFKPQEFNSTYQRASTPFQTMFYGTVIPEDVQPGELDNARIIGVAETIPILRDKTKSGYQKIAFGRWYVQQDVNLIAIIQNPKYAKESSYTRELAKSYNEFVNNTSKDMAARSIVFSTYLAEEFSKNKIIGDYDYMISALFSELLTQRGFDGVLYPSVRVDGKGFNIAITPESTNKIGLYVVGECSIYKLRDHTVVGNDALATLNGTEETFKLKNIYNHKEECLHQLGVTSIDELR